MASEKDIFDRVRVDKRPGRDIQLGSSSVKSAYRATQKLPQAVLKVKSYTSGSVRTNTLLTYISKEGEADVEDPQGNLLKDPEELKERIEEWAHDFDKNRKKSRDSVHLILSAPKGSELGAVERSVREFAQNEFGKTNDYLFAIHSDTDHPHGHLMVKMRGYDGEKMNPGRKDLREWRESFAQSLRENGVEVEASSRSSRGVGRKGSSQSVHHIRQRGERPTVDQEAAKDAIIDFNQKKDARDKPWSKAAKEKTKEHREELKKIAIAAKKAANESGNISLNVIANTIYKHAEKIPEPKTRAEEYQEKLLHQQGQDRDR